MHQVFLLHKHSLGFVIRLSTKTVYIIIVSGLLSQARASAHLVSWLWMSVCMFVCVYVCVCACVSAPEAINN